MVSGGADGLTHCTCIDPRSESGGGRYRHLVKGHYRIIYRVDGRIVRILCVWDRRRDPDDLIPGD